MKRQALLKHLRRYGCYPDGLDMPPAFPNNSLDNREDWPLIRAL